MKDNLTWLLVSPEALRRGWLGWTLSGAVARTGGLDMVWAGLVEEPGGRAGLLVFRGEDAAVKLSAAVGSVRDAGSLAAMLGEGMLSAAQPAPMSLRICKSLPRHQATPCRCRLRRGPSARWSWSSRTILTSPARVRAP